MNLVYNFPHQGCFVLSFVEIVSVFLEKNSSMNFFTLFRYHLPFEKKVALYLNKHESPLPKEGLCQVCLKFAHKSGEHDF